MVTPTERRIQNRFKMDAAKYIRDCGRRHLDVSEIAVEADACERTIRHLIKKHNIPMKYVPVPDGE